MYYYFRRFTSVSFLLPFIHSFGTLARKVLVNLTLRDSFTSLSGKPVPSPVC
jgi:hypothetical protein